MLQLPRQCCNFGGAPGTLAGNRFRLAHKGKWNLHITLPLRLGEVVS